MDSTVSRIQLHGLVTVICATRHKGVQLIVTKAIGTMPDMASHVTSFIHQLHDSKCVRLKQLQDLGC